MSRNRYTPEQIISMLREAEVALAQGQSIGQACRTLGVSEQSYYRWHKGYGGLGTDQGLWCMDLRISISGSASVFESLSCLSSSTHRVATISPEPSTGS